MKYLNEYIKVAPMSLAFWRVLEANALGKVKLSRPILDIGCGFGEFSGVFFKSFVEVGVDISERDLLLAKEKQKYKKLILADARQLPFPNNKFKSVISISVLEHIPEVETVFPEIFRVLQPGGIFTFTVPTSVLNDALILPPPRGWWLKVYHWSFKHKVILPKNTWINWCKKAGFEIKESSGTISRKQLLAFQAGLPLALPSQIHRLFFTKRLIVLTSFRRWLLRKVIYILGETSTPSDANIIIIAQKPKS